MTIKLSVPDLTELRPRITVFGVGGAGGNAVGNMINSNLEGVEFVVANTDAQSLGQSPCDRRIQIGASITEGLGAGSRPEIGRAAAEESLTEILDHLAGCHMVFITAGMGGGTGTGAGPVIAKAAKEQGILTVGVVTKPFQFEGAHRMAVAEAGIEELQNYVDTLLVIPNQNLFRLANENTTFTAAFALADEVLYSGVRGITDLMVMPGLINLDFADVRTVMNEMGKAMMGTGEAEGEKRALEAAEAAISNPLLDDVSMKGARGVLINITGGPDLGLYEVDEAANRIRSEVDPDANIIVGSTFDERLEGKMRVSVVATGIDTIAEVEPVPQDERAADRTAAARARLASLSTSRPSQVAAMTDAIKEGLSVASETEPEDDLAYEDEDVAAEVPAPQPVRRAAPKPAARGQAPRAATRAAARQASAAEAFEEDEVEFDEPEEAPREPDISEQVRATIKGGMGVFDRMMAGVKSARRANRAAQPVRRPPALSRTEQAARPAAAPARPERVRREAEPAAQDDPLVPISEDEEQLEIPAFLRRQAN